MSIINKFKGFDTIKETVFAKDFNKNNLNLINLESLLNKTSDLNTKKSINRDISLIKWGLEGENHVYFELKNSFLPMICLHDIRIQVGDLFAQIDFLILTNRFFYILETKHLVGDIKINSEGDFIRITKDDDLSKKEEGMYNPVTQGSRHARILRKFLENNDLLNIPDFPIKSVAVLANPKTILDKESAPNHIKDNIYRCDQIVHFLQTEFCNSSYDIMLSDLKLDKISDYLLKSHTPIEYDYESKYKIKSSKSHEKTSNNPEVLLDYDDLREKLKHELKKLRKAKSKEHSIKAYELFTNKQLDLLVTHLPKNIVTLNFLNIIPKKGAYLIGSDIVNIISKYSISSKDNITTSKIDYHLTKKLKDYRFKKAKSLSIDEYKIFTNKQLDEILKLNPEEIKDLSKIQGFKVYQINSYGKDIVNIINKNDEE